MPDEDDLGKLSISELKKQIRWLGAAIPSGHLEKSDLVVVLRKFRAEKAETDRLRVQKATEQKQQQPTCAAPKETRPLNYDQKMDDEKQDVIDSHLLSEDELKTKITNAGGEIPAGNVGKFYLVSLLRASVRKQEQLAAELQEQRDAAEESAKAEETMLRDLQLAAAAEEAEEQRKIEAKRKREQSQLLLRTDTPLEEDGGAPFDDRDPSELPASELRQRLRAYGSYGVEKLRGLAEKQEFIDALREAISERGPPPRLKKPVPPQLPEGNVDPVVAPQPAAPAVASPNSPCEGGPQGNVAQGLLDEATLRAAAAAGCAAAEAAAAKATTVYDHFAEVVIAGTATKCGGTGGRATGGNRTGGRRESDGRRAGTRRPAPVDADRPKAKRERNCEVFVSDGEDDVVLACGVPVAIVDGDEVCHVVETKQKTVRSSNAEAKQKSDDGEVCHVDESEQQPVPASNAEAKQNSVPANNVEPEQENQWTFL